MGEGKALFILLGLFCLFVYGIVSLISHVGDSIYDKKIAWENTYLEKIGMMYTNVLDGSHQCYTLFGYEKLLHGIIEFVNPKISFNDKNIDNTIIIKMYRATVDNNARNKCPLIDERDGQTNHYRESDILFMITKTLKN